MTLHPTQRRGGNCVDECRRGNASAGRGNDCEVRLNAIRVEDRLCLTDAKLDQKNSEHVRKWADIQPAGSISLICERKIWPEARNDTSPFGLNTDIPRVMSTCPTLSHKSRTGF